MLTNNTIYVIAGIRVALTIWRENSAGPIHALHTGYSLGSIIVPQLVTPFLDSRFSGGVVETGYNSTCRLNVTAPSDNRTGDTTSQPTSPDYPAKFVTAYWILSGFSLSIVVVFVVYHIHKLVCHRGIENKQIMKKKNTFRESLSPRSCSPSHPTYAVMIVTLLFFYYLIAVPLMRAFTKFMFSYARDGPCLSVSEATSLESTFFAASAVGRFSAFLVSTKVHMKYILQVRE